MDETAMKKTAAKHHASGSISRLRKHFPQIRRVVDAVESAIVTVTRQDNQHADVQNHRTCAFAKASTRCLEADGAMIGLSTSWLVHGDTGVRYLNSGTVSREITSFDRNAGFDEGQYILAAPPISGRLGVSRSNNPRRSGRGKGLLRFRHFTRNVRASLQVA